MLAISMVSCAFAAAGRYKITNVRLINPNLMWFVLSLILHKILKAIARTSAPPVSQYRSGLSEVTIWNRVAAGNWTVVQYPRNYAWILTAILTDHRAVASFMSASTRQVERTLLAVPAGVEMAHCMLSSS